MERVFNASNLYPADLLNRSGVKKLRDDKGREFAWKSIFCGDAEVCMNNEITFSKLAKRFDINAVRTRRARFRKSHGIISKWFLNEQTQESRVLTLSPPRGIIPECFQEISLLSAARDFEKLNNPEAIKNLVETYLHSVFIANSDHRITQDYLTGRLYCKNIMTICDKRGKMLNLAPYHDMEASAHSGQRIQGTKGYEPEYIQIGYRKNLPALRTKFKKLHDKYLDGLNSVDFTEYATGGMITKLENQAAFMKDFK